MSASPDAFVAAARGLLNAPWLHLGRSSAGVDCVGLVIVAAWESGAYGGPDITGYSRTPDGRTLKAALAAHLDIVPAGGRRVGDIACFSGGLRFPCHIGIVGDGRRQTLIHAFAEYGKVVEHDLHARFAKGRLVAVYRLRGF